MIRVQISAQIAQSSSRAPDRRLRFSACAHFAAPLARPGRADHPDPDPARFDPDIAAFEKWDHQNAVPAQRHPLRRQLEHPPLANGRRLPRPARHQPRLRRLARSPTSTTSPTASSSSTSRARSSSTPATTTSPPANRPTKSSATSETFVKSVHDRLARHADHLPADQTQPRPLENLAADARRQRPRQRPRRNKTTTSRTSTPPRPSSAPTAKPRKELFRRRRPPPERRSGYATLEPKSSRRISREPNGARSSLNDTTTSHNAISEKCSRT